MKAVLRLRVGGKLVAIHSYEYSTDGVLSSFRVDLVPPMPDKEPSA